MAPPGPPAQPATANRLRRTCHGDAFDTQRQTTRLFAWTSFVAFLLFSESGQIITCPSNRLPEYGFSLLNKALKTVAWKTGIFLIETGVFRFAVSPPACYRSGSSRLQPGGRRHALV
jgi:hypothetical protein